MTNLEQLSKETNTQQRTLAAMQQELRTKIYEIKTASVQSRTMLAGLDEQIRKLTQEQPIIASELQSLDQQEKFVTEQQQQHDKNASKSKPCKTRHSKSAGWNAKQPAVDTVGKRKSWLIN